MAKIVAVDDSVTMRKVLEITFVGSEHSVVTAASGQDALRVVEEQGADLVIADLSMDNLDGYALSERLSTDARFGNVPVLVMASANAPYDPAKAMRAGVAGYVNKPFETKDLIAKAKAALAQGGAAARAFEGAPATQIASPTAALAAARPAAPAAPAVATPKQVAPNLAKTAMGVAPMAVSPVGSSSVAQSPTHTPNPAPVSPVASGDRKPVVPCALRMPSSQNIAAAVGSAVAGTAGQLNVQSPTHAAPTGAVAASHTAASNAAASNAAASNAVASNAVASMAEKLPAGLTAEQADAILLLTRDVVERVVWEVVPDLAEAMIREELARLTR